MKQICKKLDCYLAGIEQDIENFSFRKDTNKYRGECKNCIKQKSNKYYHKNTDLLLTKAHIYGQTNKDKIAKRKIIYQEFHKVEKQEYDKQYYQRNKEKIKINNYLTIKNKRKEDKIFQLKCAVAHSIRNALKRNQSSKNNNSILNFLSYSIQELKEHLEKQFEYWMSWENWGTYRINIWDNNDPTTWTWQIDHIIPHSTFNYISMEDQEFKDCWSLNNLRPYSAKQNIIDGNR